MQLSMLLILNVLASNPTQAWRGSTSRPSTDSVPAVRCCCYPNLRLPEIDKSQIRTEVILAMILELNICPPHMVSASEPNCKGQQLRLSTSFLERRLVRSLTTLQGQVFVTIKYIIKQVLPKRSVKGLKTYHAKTVMFHLLDETPEEEWQVQNLLKLVERALKLLCEDLKSGSDPDCCMQHFFLSDAKVYLKKNHDSKSKIATAIEVAIQDLPDVIRSFMKKLRQNQASSGEFCFNPFLILPDPGPSSDGLSGSSGIVDICDIYNAVRSIWVRLAEGDSTMECYDSLMRDISRLPQCADTTTCCLKALTSMKCGKEDEAKAILRSFKPTNPGFIRPADLASVSDVSEFVQSKLDTCDWAKKFSFVFPGNPKLSFLPDSIGQHFPLCILYVNLFFVNFQALYRGLCLELDVADENQKMTWFKEILDQDEAELQEILVMLQFCKNRDMLVSLIHKHRKAIAEQRESSDKALKLLQSDPELMRQSEMASVRLVLTAKSAPTEKCHNNSLQGI